MHTENTDVPTTTALKEWGAAVHALIDGRQTILLRKGGIHEKAFVPPESGGGFLLYPTVAHSHADRTRDAHRSLLELGDGDVTDDAVTIRAGVNVIGVVEVSNPDGVEHLEDLHIWTTESIWEDRIRFRPKKPLSILVVQTLVLPTPVQLSKLERYGGCVSWIELETSWAGQGTAVHTHDRLKHDLERVTAAVG